MKQGLYVYCIVEAKEPRSFDVESIGGEGNDVYMVSHGDIGAVVSVSPIRKYPVARDHLIAHERAIEEVMKTHTVLPVRFATITENEEKLRMVLQRERTGFVSLLGQMKGKKELGLKILFKEDRVYGDLIEKYSEVRNLKEEIESLPPDKSYHQRIEIGHMVEAALREEKEFYRTYALDRLAPLAVEVKRNSEYGDMMVMNASFLVEKEKEREFDMAVQQIEDNYGDRLRLRYVGTLPPFNFVSLVINTEEGPQCSS